MPKVTAKLENISINEGQDAQFICKFVSTPAAQKVTWIKNDSEELNESENLSITSTESSTILTIKNAKSTDTGTTYLVKIGNELGEVASNKATLTVSSGPVFVVEPTDQNVLKDKEVKFECVVKANPKPNIIWLFNGKEITSRDGVRLEKDVAKDKYTLVIPKVTPAHVGSVTVKAANEFGSIEKSCQLEVLDAPRVVNKLENATVNEGDAAKFLVKFSGKPKPSVKWFKDDAEIQIDESIEIVESADEEITLVIKSCKSTENSGTYFAKVINEHGENSSNKATLTINSKISNRVGLFISVLYI